MSFNEIDYLSQFRVFTSAPLSNQMGCEELIDISIN